VGESAVAAQASRLNAAQAVQAWTEAPQDSDSAATEQDSAGRVPSLHID